ncbi:MAG: response regulator [Candidatus Pacebacteria bacterium]|nr:response regulator [Candidatus Paceibacterota bacterium]
MKILVIEDEEVLSKVLQEKFEKSGYDVAVANDGDAALTLAKDTNPDAIVLDLLLPKRNGFEVLESLKSDQMLKMIPVVVVSNLGEDSDIKRALSLGAADYYVKSEHPINEIVEKIKNVLIHSK